MMVHSRPRMSPAFTLIELLVVVAIIALLISILLPSLNKARAQARVVKCQSNYKQLGVGNHMYAGDSDNYFVPISEGNGSGGWWVWSRNPKFRGIMDLDRNRNWNDWPDGLKCPDLPDEYFDMPQKMLGGMNRENALPEGWTGWSGIPLLIHRVSVHRSADTAQMTDANDWNVTMAGANYAQRWDITGELNGNEGGSWNNVMYRHNEGTNILHFDGHAAYYTKQEAWDDVTERRRLWRIYR